MFISRLFSANGRVSRLYWWAIVFFTGVYSADRYDSYQSAAEFQTSTSSWQIGFGLLFSWIAIATFIKRLHDLGRTGWWALLAFFPPSAIVMIVWLGLFPGQRGTNRYGEPNSGSPFQRREQPMRDKVTAT